MIKVVAFLYSVPLKPSRTKFGSTGPPNVARHDSVNFSSSCDPGYLENQSELNGQCHGIWYHFKTPKMFLD